MTIKLANYNDLEEFLAKGHRLSMQIDIEIVKLGNKYHVNVRSPHCLRGTPFNTLEEAMGWISTLAT